MNLGINLYVSNNEYNFVNCIYDDNTTGERGGALFVQTYQNIMLQDCRFTKNKSQKGNQVVYIETDFGKCPDPNSQSGTLNLPDTDGNLKN